MQNKTTMHAAGYTATGISAALLAALFLGGSPSAPPAPIATPQPDLVTVPGMVSQVFRWTASPDATGYRLFLDGASAGNVPGTWTATQLSIKCGTRHRFNAQPFNNRGLAPLAPPVYVTPSCDGATK